MLARLAAIASNANRWAFGGKMELTIEDIRTLQLAVDNMADDGMTDEGVKKLLVLHAKLELMATRLTKRVLALMDEIEIRHGINEDRWDILRSILEKQEEREATQQSEHLTGFPECASCEYQPCDLIPQNHADYCPARK